MTSELKPRPFYGRKRRKPIEAWNTRTKKTTTLTRGYVDSREMWEECNNCGLTSYHLKGEESLFDWGHCPQCGLEVGE